MAVVYTLANPSAAGLVAHPEDWPGLCVLPGYMGCLVKTVRRPPVYFSEDTDMPEEVTVRITVPPQFCHLTAPEWQKLVTERLDERLTEIREDRAAKGKGFLGKDEVLARTWSDTTSTDDTERMVKDPKRGRPSRWAGSKEYRKQRRKERREFLRAHFAACNRFERGEPAVFPMGSFWMKKRWRVRCVGDDALDDWHRPPPRPAKNRSEPESLAAA